ncbi:MAG: response regulator [Moorea sp. SIO4E2]|uniref:response regulator transcription factor n=1 Tax=Moorena sp. SIO4E2 TaxID=2607826 RepID=UPI0013B869CA|nr:response regulator [Moorena sp. SIO4E2]NEQ07337.1 response regulator [Moorena sp. SIO4E2]
MKTVLVVEDSVTERQYLTRCLQQAGLGVTGVASVEEAREKLSHQRPDLVVLDVILPGQSGFEFCRALKVNPHTSQIPVVICSTKGTEVDKIWGKMLGADAYLAKPVTPEELLCTLEELIQ